MKYEGEFLNGLKHGQGTFTDAFQWTYTGSFKNDLRHGLGKEISRSGDRYEGDWRKGRKEGYGVESWSDGRTYEGYWSDVSRKGKGRLVTKHGDVITGIFNAGYGVSASRRCGRKNSLPLDHPSSDGKAVQCKLVKSNGDVVEGSFYGNQPDGFAIYRFANGDVYEGNFIAGKPNGEGTLTYANGDVISGLWKNGISQAKIEAEKRAKEIKRQQAVEAELAKRVEDRLTACDSFGFERGTDSHAECAMQLYINEQNQATASQVTEQQRDEQQAVLDQQQKEQEALLARQKQQLARQEAIQEAILKEQERARNWEQSMKLIELGTGIATGSLFGRPTPKMESHTYTINGQIINCTTTGSSTDCR